MNIRDFIYKLNHWETWHYLAKYIPLAPAWLWFCLKSRSLWFFSSSNPTLTFGGFEGESKMEMYEQLPAGSYPKSILISSALSFNEVEQKFYSSHFNYPFAVKPDVGMMGFLFRKIRSKEAFRKYHEQINVDYIIQDFVNYPIEVSVFYYRYPGNKKGVITGFLKKEFLEVTGDGVSSLWELIQQYPRVRFRLEEMRAKHETKLNEILAVNEIYCLSPALNLSRGGKLVSLNGEKNDKLLEVFDAISNHTKYFYYGRYDIKCASVDDLRNGKNFTILEFNGSGAEPHHIYGNGYTLMQAYRIVLHHWKTLYHISKINHQSGTRYWSFHRGWVFLKKAKQHFKLLKVADQALEL